MKTLPIHITRVVPVNPNGIPSFSPGLRGTIYPGSWRKIFSNPNGVASVSIHLTAATPLGLDDSFPRTQGSLRKPGNPGLNDAILLGLKTRVMPDPIA